MLRTIRRKVSARMVSWLANHAPWTSVSAVGNRVIYTAASQAVPGYSVTMTLQDPRKGMPGYSREELYVMLRTVREEELRQGWKCPEPEMKVKGE